MRLSKLAWLAVCLLIVAVVLPPALTARWLAGSSASPELISGLIIWKVLLGGHALALWWWVRRPASGSSSTPRSDSGDDDARVGAHATDRHAHAGGIGEYAVEPDIDARRAGWILAGLVLLALVLRQIDLGSGLWFDEIKTYALYITQSFGAIVTTFDDQNQHLLYSALAKISVLILGDGSAPLRMPAVLFGVASVWAVYWFGSMITSRTEALLTAAVLAVSYHHVWFSQNGRGYTALLFWTILSTGFFVRLIRNQNPRRLGLALAYAMTTALALYTHLTAAVLPVSHAAVALWVVYGPRSEAQPDESSVRPAVFPLLAGIVLSGTVALQLYAPVLWGVGFVVTQESTFGHDIVWQTPTWLITETLTVLAAGVPGGVLVLIPAAMIGLIGVASFARRSGSILAAMVLPVVATVVAIIAMGHNLWPRFFFFGAGFALLIGLRGLFATTEKVLGARGRTVAAVLAGLAALASLTTVPGAWANKQDFDGAEAYMDEHVAPGDAVTVVDMTILPYDLYYGRDWAHLFDAEQLREIEGEHERTWLLYTFPTSVSTLYPEIWERIESEYRVAERFPGSVGGGDIFVVVRE